jgi:hypothetical protein
MIPWLNAHALAPRLGTSFPAVAQITLSFGFRRRRGWKARRMTRAILVSTVGTARS